MKIKEIISQHRRDFRAVYECEHCKYEHKDTGYDDFNFHKHVIPSMKCPKCNKTATTKPEDTNIHPRHPEGFQI